MGKGGQEDQFAVEGGVVEAAQSDQAVYNMRKTISIFVATAMIWDSEPSGIMDTQDTGMPVSVCV